MRIKLLSPARKIRKRLERSRVARAYVRWRIGRTGFWFVDVPRTGSTSLRAELGQAFGSLHGKSDIVDAQYAKKSVIQPHQSALQMRAFMGADQWNSLFTFSFVRNPWSRSLSLYHYIQKRSSDPVVKSWSINEHLEYIALVRGGGQADHAPYQYRPITMSASEFLIDSDGVLLVDEVFRFEDRAAAMTVISDRLKLSNFNNIHFQAATPGDQQYIHVFDKAARRLVEEMFAEDIDRFGYRFGDP